MGFLDLFKTEKPHTPSTVTISFVLAKHFKGFKKFPMVVYGNSEREQNNESLKNVSLPGRSIVFVKNRQGVDVFIDNLFVGAIFDHGQIKALEQGTIESVFAKVEDETVIGKRKTETRHRVFLFVKYKEGR